MKKILIFSFLLLIGVFVLSGCQGVDLSKVSDEDIERISEKAVVCNEPYIRFGTGCCLDQNNNDVCDDDESEGAPSQTSRSVGEETAGSCSDECSTDSCRGSEHIACLKQSDGCNDEVSRSKVVGKCGVECLSNSDCGSNKRCASNKCEVAPPQCSDVCSSDSCEGGNYIACLRQSNGCKNNIDRGKVAGKCGVECLSDSDCGSDEECSSNECIVVVEETTESNLCSGGLTGYPGMFITGGVFNGYFVVGELDSGSGNIAMTEIASSMPAEVVDAAKLDSEIASVEAQNLIVVGNPCVNTIAADLLGWPGDCHEGFVPGQARIKILEHTTGAVSMLVAGYSDADTRLGAKVVANRAGELSGDEVFVEGTTWQDATLSCW